MKDRLTIAREEIETLDQSLVTLFLQRMDLVSEIADYKQANGMDVLDSKREEFLKDLILKNVDPRYVHYAKPFYEMILDLSKLYQEERMKEEQ